MEWLSRLDFLLILIFSRIFPFTIQDFLLRGTYNCSDSIREHQCNLVAIRVFQSAAGADKNRIRKKYESPQSGLRAKSGSVLHIIICCGTFLSQHTAMRLMINAEEEERNNRCRAIRLCTIFLWQLNIEIVCHFVWKMYITKNEQIIKINYVIRFWACEALRVKEKRRKIRTKGNATRHRRYSLSISAVMHSKLGEKWKFKMAASANFHFAFTRHNHNATPTKNYHTCIGLHTYDALTTCPRSKFVVFNTNAIYYLTVIFHTCRLSIEQALFISLSRKFQHCVDNDVLYKMQGHFGFHQINFLLAHCGYRICGKPNSKCNKRCDETSVFAALHLANPIQSLIIINSFKIFLNRKWNRPKEHSQIKYLETWSGELAYCLSSACSIAVCTVHSLLTQR